MNRNTKYFKINNLNHMSIQYGFFSRLGGYSENKYTSLNCNLNSGDQKGKTIKNIDLTKKILDLNHTKIKFLNQTHGTNVKLINTRNFNTNISADGSITIDKKISLAILTADCAPVFLFDKKNHLICALHSGWKSCLGNIISKAVKKINNINKDNNKIIAIIGPCLSHKYFEVNENFKKKFIKKNLEYEKFFYYDLYSKKIHFNMRDLLHFQLEEMHINKIYHVKKDTYSENKIFFSHRRATHANLLPTGRMINIIGFKKQTHS